MTTLKKKYRIARRPNGRKSWNPSAAEQKPPEHNASRPIWELVIEDMHARDRVGRAKYGTPLQANNGRDALLDAYQEVLDLCVYLRQAMEERKEVRCSRNQAERRPR